MRILKLVGLALAGFLVLVFFILSFQRVGHTNYKMGPRSEQLEKDMASLKRGEAPPGLIAKRTPDPEPTPDAEWLKTKAGKVWQKHPEWSRKDCIGIANHNVWIGMTQEQAVASVGKPQRVNRTVSASGHHEQWIYPGSVYLYVDNGVLTSWQDGGR